MTTLYIAQGACSLGAHVVVRELALPVQLEKVKLRTPESVIHKVNPLGRVPALQLDDGQVITENSAILPFLADLKPGNSLFAPAGSTERGLIQSWIGYLSAEVHAGAFRVTNRPERFSADETAHDSIRKSGKQLLRSALQHIDLHLSDKDWLVGNRFTIADAYLGVFARWTSRFGNEFDDLENLARFRDHYLSRPAVIAALAFEEAA